MPSSVWLSHEKQKKLHSFLEHLFSQVGQLTSAQVEGTDPTVVLLVLSYSRVLIQTLKYTKQGKNYRL